MTLIRKNGKTATFAGIVNGDASKLKYTVYPVPNAEGKISMAKVNGKNHNAPMYGTIEGSGAKLEYAGGLVKLDINGAGDGTFKAEGSNNSTTKVTGGHYKFNTTDKKLVFVPGSPIVEITNIPSDGVVFLPIATDAASNAPEPVEVTLTTPEGNTITDNVVVAKGASTQSEENSFPELKYDKVNGLLEINKISNFNELKSAFQYGGAYRLMKDINATETLISNNTLFLDLNGYHLQDTANFEREKPLIKVTGGKIDISNNTERPGGVYHQWDVLKVVNPAEVIVNEGVEIYSRFNCCIWLDANESGFNDANNSIITIAGNIQSDAPYNNGSGDAAIFVNGTLTDIDMTIKGGTVVSDSVVTVYFPGNGNLTIEGGEITGYESAVEYRGTGLLKIQGGTFMTTSTEFKKGADNNGTTIKGAAVVVSPHNGRTPNVEITGSSLKSHMNKQMSAMHFGKVL